MNGQADTHPVPHVSEDAAVAKLAKVVAPDLQGVQLAAMCKQDADVRRLVVQPTPSQARRGAKPLSLRFSDPPPLAPFGEEPAVFVPHVPLADLDAEFFQPVWIDLDDGADEQLAGDDDDDVDSGVPGSPPCPDPVVEEFLDLAAAGSDIPIDVLRRARSIDHWDPYASTLCALPLLACHQLVMTHPIPPLALTCLLEVVPAALREPRDDKSDDAQAAVMSFAKTIVPLAMQAVPPRQLLQSVAEKFPADAAQIHQGVWRLIHSYLASAPDRFAYLDSYQQ